MSGRFKTWRSWKRYSLNGPLYKLGVLLGIVKSTTFELVRFHLSNHEDIKSMIPDIQYDDAHYEKFKEMYIRPVNEIIKESIERQKK